ncbi:flavin-containing monooxygenase [Mycobacteroides chelonae]|nr:monooxygenase [Mycobacterium sp. QIA-37]
MTEKPQFEVVIIGAGFSGIGAGILLDKSSIRDWVILEEGAGVGGAWYWNTYPGVGVDIPSYSYQFSFERNPEWSRVYAPGAELRGYAEHCVSKYGLADRIRFDTTVVAAEFDQEAALWRVRTRSGDVVTGRYVINATGQLTKPKLPDIAGLDTFRGAIVHTARWSDDIDLTGKRVAVIGTGASALQAIPIIAEEVEHLTVFQRTPIWCLPKPDIGLPSSVRFLFRRIPPLSYGPRLAAHAFAELEFPLTFQFGATLPLPQVAEYIGRAFLRSQVADPVTREKLTPRYSFGCKRPSISNTYLRTFNRDNVELVTDPIGAVTTDGITAGGRNAQFDVIILATGFKVFDGGNLPAFPITGVDGVDLEGWWAKERLQAYEGVSVPRFPNFFWIFGPYGYNGTSYFRLIEHQMHHILRCLKKARRSGATRIEISESANARFFQSVLARRKHQVFYSANCATANSYYFDQHGDVPWRAATTPEIILRSKTFSLGDYHFTGPRAAHPIEADASSRGRR